MKYELTIITLVILLIATTSIIIINSDFENNEVINPERKAYHIPDWVKHSANWWSEGYITDQEFSFAIEYLIDENIITVDECVGECLVKD